MVFASGERFAGALFLCKAGRMGFIVPERRTFRSLEHRCVEKTDDS